MPKSTAQKFLIPNTVSLLTVIEMLEGALDEARRLDGTELFDGGKNSPENRDLNHRLLFLADGLQLASALVRSEYWASKGRML